MVSDQRWQLKVGKKLLKRRRDKGRKDLTVSSTQKKPKGK